MHAALVRILWLVALVAPAPAAAAAGALPAAPSPPVDWRWAALGERIAAPTALARDAATGRLAVGDVHGVLIGRAGQGFRRVALRGAVSDVVFTSDGTLLAATSVGLERIAADGHRSEGAPGPGAAARTLHRLATLAGVTVLGSDAGLYVSADTRSWHHVTGPLPSGAATALALQPHGDGWRCWAAIGGELWRVDLRSAGAGFGVTAARRIVIPFADGREGVVDIAGEPGGAVVVVFPQRLALELPGAAANGSSTRWEVVRPQLPPGGQALRLQRGGAELWLATDRGLLVAESLAGPWRRAAPPAGTVSVTAVVAADGEVAAVGDDGLLIGARRRPSPEPPAAAAGRSPALPRDPPIAAVHRAAIRYLGLERARLEELRRSVRRRAWWPVVALRGAAGWDHSLGIDYDQSFVSGEMRFLTDRGIDRDDAFDVSLALTWDLAGIAYDPESIDVSRETREVIELRDDVLDEITQLYFERRAALEALQAGGTAVGDSAQLRLRAEALAAGIDAWTGGWFGAQLQAATPPAPGPARDPGGAP